MRDEQGQDVRVPGQRRQEGGRLLHVWLLMERVPRRMQVCQERVRPCQKVQAHARVAGSIRGHFSC
jgi:hypothetical protein